MSNNTRERDDVDSKRYDPADCEGTIDPTGHRLASLLFGGFGISGLLFGGWQMVVGGFLVGLPSILVAIVLIAISLMFRRRHHADVRHERFATGRCPSCGYDRRGLPQPRCPECGTTWESDQSI